MKSFGVVVPFAEVGVDSADERGCMLSSVPVISPPIRAENAQACVSCLRPGFKTLERACMLRFAVAVFESGTEVIMSEQTSKKVKTILYRIALNVQQVGLSGNFPVKQNGVRMRILVTYLDYVTVHRGKSVARVIETRKDGRRLVIPNIRMCE
jgi:hypothetical protein